MAYLPWAFLYFGSSVLLGSFAMVNLLIGVVINSPKGGAEQTHTLFRAAPRRRPCLSRCSRRRC
ncbi:hypothetical protein U9R90_02930 [Streptomyces sp. E11-3]|uniref:hypothetical protein n=1 Tax=Streptomyces sp. E11-3 TaxID=3110112 RepID=UPI00397F049F